MRSLLSILLIGVPVTLILCLVGLSHGFIEDSQKRQRGVGADILVRPKSSSFLSLNGAPIPQQLVGYLARQPHVKMATGVYSVTLEGVSLVVGRLPVSLGRSIPAARRRDSGRLLRRSDQSQSR